MRDNHKRTPASGASHWFRAMAYCKDNNLAPAEKANWNKAVKATKEES